jgi:glucan 1,3-beta-glucosidase
MSYRKEHILSLKPESESSYIAGESENSLKDLFKEILENGIHGFCFSLYEDGQKPGDIISEEQVRRRMEIH